MFQKLYRVSAIIATCITSFAIFISYKEQVTTTNESKVVNYNVHSWLCLSNLSYGVKLLYRIRHAQSHKYCEKEVYEHALSGSSSADVEIYSITIYLAFFSHEDDEIFYCEDNLELREAHQLQICSVLHRTLRWIILF